MAGPGSLILSILMIAAFLFAAGGLWLIVKRGERTKGVLMLLVALVALANVLIWTV